MVSVIGKSIFLTIPVALAALEQDVEPALARRAGPTRRKRGVGAGTFEHLPLDRPGFAAVFAAADLKVPGSPGRQHRAIGGNHHIGRTPTFEHLLHLEFRLTQQRVNGAFHRHKRHGDSKANG